MYTWQDLMQFGLFILTLISLIYQMIEKKK